MAQLSRPRQRLPRCRRRHGPAAIPMTMQDWETRLNRFIEATDREILQDAGKVTAEIAKAHAESEFEKYRIVQDRLYVSDFDAEVMRIARNDEESGNEEGGAGVSAEFQQTEIGEFPAAWEINRVDSAFDIQQGKQVSKKNRDGEHQRPFLRNQERLLESPRTD
ncbi:MAG: virulence RhuM family protein [Rhodocyclaceae bacterium]|nr:virulence RhuM family protein [Rhodocyclaceae bacterium]